MRLKNYDKLAEDITKILIFSNFENLFGMGETAKEINSFEERAIDFYSGKPLITKNKILINYFKTRIDRDVARIMECVVKMKFE